MLVMVAGATVLAQDAPVPAKIKGEVVQVMQQPAPDTPASSIP